MAKQFAVLGSPIDHSKSPLIHKAAYELLGLDWTYSRQELEAVELQGFLETSLLAGASLTMPLKDAAYNLVHTDDTDAIAAGAINTILRTAHGWAGFNTDVFGMVKALEDVTFSKVLILGSGATARNAVLAVKRLNPDATLAVLARDAEKARALVDFADANGLTPNLEVQPGDLAKFQLTISTLPPNSDTSGWFEGTPRGTLLDVAYSPWPSQLARQWAEVGGNVVSGIEMLVWQAIAQIRIFTSGNVAETLDNEDQIAAIMRKAAEG